MSDWEEYAERLKHKLNYKNTYYHKEPQLDIISLPLDLEGKCDFIISTDVFEHVEPPISIAFENTRKLLKPNGVFIFSVPYLKEGKTIEHFPELCKYEVIKNNDGCFLKNITRNGVETGLRSFGLSRRGGYDPRDALFFKRFFNGRISESRFYKRSDLWDQDLKYGIRWEIDYSLPIAARIK